MQVRQQAREPGHLADLQPPVTENGGQPGAKASSAPDSKTRTGGHKVNIRLSIPLFVGRYYLTIFLGTERRSRTRLKKERRKFPLVTRGNLVFLGFLGTAAGLALFAIIQFAAKLMFDQTDVL